MLVGRQLGQRAETLAAARGGSSEGGARVAFGPKTSRDFRARIGYRTHNDEPVLRPKSFIISRLLGLLRGYAGPLYKSGPAVLRCCR